jgi:hypothetical protein
VGSIVKPGRGNKQLWAAMPAAPDAEGAPDVEGAPELPSESVPPVPTEAAP